MSRALDGQVAVVTGGASGIGRAVVRRFVAEGAAVVVLDRDGAALPAVEEEGGGRVATVTGAAHRSDDVDAAVAVARDRFGSLDTFVANAGVHDHFRSLRSLNVDELSRAFDDLFTVNVKAVLVGASCALPLLFESSGSIVVTLSSASFQAGGGGPLYTASKHAVLGVVRQLAYELAPNVRVNGVAPGATRTRLRGAPALGDHGTDWDDPGIRGAAEAVTPLGFVADPAEHAAAFVLLASRRDGRTMTATVVRSDGGMAVPVRPGRAHEQREVP